MFVEYYKHITDILLIYISVIPLQYYCTLQSVILQHCSNIAIFCAVWIYFENRASLSLSLICQTSEFPILAFWWNHSAIRYFSDLLGFVRTSDAIPLLFPSRFSSDRLTWSMKTRRAHFCGIPDKGRGSQRPPPTLPAVQPPDIPDPHTRRTLPGCWRAWNFMVFHIHVHTYVWLSRREKLQRPCSYHASLRKRRRRNKTKISANRGYGLSENPGVRSIRCLLNTVAVSVVTLCSHVIDVMCGRPVPTFYCGTTNRFFSPMTRTPASNDYR